MTVSATHQKLSKEVEEVSNEELREQSNRSSPYIKIACGLWVIAAMVIMISAVTGLALAVSASDYFSHSKAVRDAAVAGS